MGEFSSSSSSEEDGDSEWKAAINSAAAGASSVMSSFMNGFSANENGGGGGGGDYNQSKTQQLPKHYQIKVSLPNQSPYYLYFVFHLFQFNGFVVSL